MRNDNTVGQVSVALGLALNGIGALDIKAQRLDQVLPAVLPGKVKLIGGIGHLQPVVWLDAIQQALVDGAELLPELTDDHSFVQSLCD